MKIIDVKAALDPDRLTFLAWKLFGGVRFIPKTPCLSTSFPGISAVEIQGTITPIIKRNVSIRLSLQALDPRQTHQRPTLAFASLWE
jgi:hypothetical protein